MTQGRCRNLAISPTSSRRRPARSDRFKAACAALLLALSSASLARGETGFYSLRLEVSDDLRRVSGSLALHYVNPADSPLDSLQFFLFPNLTAGAMSVSDVRVGGAPSATAASMNGAKLRAKLAGPLAPGAALDVALDYTVAVPEDPSGRNGGFSRAGDVAAFAWCYPVVLFPSDWNNGPPATYADYLVKESTRYAVRISYGSRYQLAAAGREVARRSAADRTTVDLELAAARDFFFALGTGWKTKTARAGRVLVRVIAPAKDEERAAFAADAAARVLAIYTGRFGPYPFDSFTVVVVPLASYGLEFPGIIAISPATLSAPNRAILEGTIAHEAAHQWFYGVVGSDQVREPWLDEALAQYATWLSFADRYGDDGASGFAATLIERWDRTGRALMPIGLPVASYTDKQYASIVYGRGPLFLQALAASIGQDRMNRLLREWVTRFSGKMATGSDFFRLAEEVGGRSLRPLFAQWVWPPP